MSKMLLNLRHVPDDEADEVRALLDQHAIDFYETVPSLWGLSAGAIWVREEARFADAKRELDAYQRQRRDRARAEHAAAKRDGSAETLGMVLRREPGKVLAVLLAIAFLLMLTALPVWLLSR